MSFHISIQDFPDTFSIEENTYECIKETFLDNEICPCSDILCEIPSAKYAKGTDFTWDDLCGASEIIEERYSSKKVYILDDDENIVNEYKLNEIFCDIMNDFLSEENADVQIGFLWSMQLDDFIQQSGWNVALRRHDNKLIFNINEWPQPIINGDQIKWYESNEELTPILWFGNKEENPLEEWTMNSDGMPSIVTEENGMGSYGGQMQVQGLEINYLDLYNGDASWYFGACGEPGADFHKVIETCPIDIVSVYHGVDGCRLIAEYCLSLQKNA